MPLVNGFLLLDMVKEANSIACALNTTNLETTFAITEAIEESKLPNYIQISPTNVKLSGYEYIASIVKKIAADMDTPIALHLDHGKNMEDVKEAVKAGFTSIMIDGATKSFEENIRITREAVNYCKCYGIPVEAELGAISGKEDDMVSNTVTTTDPSMVKEFVERSGCNMLAISIGNVHGLDAIPHIDFALLKKIQSECAVPLVLHGGSGISMDILAKIKNFGVCKINIASDLRKQCIKAYGEAYMKNHNEHNLINVAMMAKESVCREALYKINALNRELTEGVN